VMSVISSISFPGLFPPKPRGTVSFSVSIHRGETQSGILFLVSIARATSRRIHHCRPWLSDVSQLRGCSLSIPCAARLWRASVWRTVWRTDTLNCFGGVRPKRASCFGVETMKEASVSRVPWNPVVAVPSSIDFLRQPCSRSVSISTTSASRSACSARVGRFSVAHRSAPSRR
jgi:hypothetical protein